MISSPQEPFVEIALSEIGQSYGRLRLVDPQADAGMVDSLRQFGQIFPVVVVPLAERYELVDGFKRLRALKQVSMISRAEGAVTAESWQATPYERFLQLLQTIA